MTEYLKEYDYPVFQYIPKDLIKENPIQLLLWCHGSCKQSTSHGIQHEIKTEFEGLKSIADDANVIMIMPAIPKCDLYDSQILERTTLEDPQCPKLFARPDKKVINVLKSQTMKLTRQGFHVHGKVLGAGISAGANFVNRLSVLYPEMFSKVALLLTGTFMYPTNEMHNTNLPYPLGTSDIEKFGFHNNLKDFKKIKHFLFVGENDTNPGPIDYELRDNPELRQICHELFGEISLEKTKHFANFLMTIGNKVQLEIGKGLGHQVNGEVINSVIRFFLI